ncbi:MAG: sortase [Flexilinea sp.]|nr:sortase [Flexilinea sp.]
MAEYEYRPNDTVDGYKFINTTDDSNVQKTMKLQKWNRSDLFIDIDFSPSLSTSITASDGYWVRAELKHKTGTPTIFVKQLVTEGTNPLRIQANEWRDSQNYNVNNNEKFTGNEPSVTVQIVKVRKGKDQNSINEIAKLNPDFVESIVIGGAVKDYLLETTDGEKEINGKYDNKDTGITTCIYNLRLTKQTLNNSITPEDVLGEAAEFGIVANRYDQFGHSETNFAANYFFDNSNIDIDGSGDTAIPFYIGKVDTKAEDGTVNNDSKFLLSQQTTVPADIFATQDDINASSPKRIEITSSKPTKLYPMAQTSINTYVNSLIEAGKNKSAEFASQTNLKPVFSGTQYTVDTTGFPDGTTIYVNADGILTSIGASGWRISKLPNQYIVFNISSTSNTTVTDTINGQSKENVPAIRIAEFYVDPNDGKGEVQSTTSALNGDKEKNQRVDDVIFSHITFNVINAEQVDLNNASALFLLPKAKRVTQSNGAGWILAKGTVHSASEWHFYRHNRSYRAKGDFVLETKKKLVDTSGNPLPFENQNFKFELLALDGSGSSSGTLIETALANAEGIVDFHSITYTNTAIPINQSKDYYYQIREVIPDDAVNSAGVRYDKATSAQKTEGGFIKNGIVYNAAPILIKVTATNTPKEGSTTEGVITAAVSVDGNTVTGTSGEHPVFNLETINKVFTNTKTIDYNATGSIILSATKEFDNWDQVPSFKLHLEADGNNKLSKYSAAELEKTVNENGHTAVFPKIDFDLTDKDKAFKFTITEDQVTDVSGSPEKIEVTITPRDNGNGIMVPYIKVGEGSEQDPGTPANKVFSFNAGTFTNTYIQKNKAILKVRKALQGADWPDNVEEVSFTLSAVTEDAPMPDVSGKTVTLNKNKLEASFGEIKFDSSNANKTYEYSIEEQANAFGNGWTRGGPIKITVKVGVGDENNDLPVTVSYEPSFTYTNIYNAIGNLKLKSSKTVLDKDNNPDEIHNNLPFELWYKSDWDKKDTDSSLEPFITEKPLIEKENVQKDFFYNIEYTLESPADPVKREENDITIYRVSLPDLVKANKATVSTDKKTYTINYFLNEKTIVDRELKEPDQSFDITVTLTDDGNGNLTPTQIVVTDIKNGQTGDKHTYTDPNAISAGVDVGKFENTERTNSAPLIISGKKLLDGQVPSEQTWDFTISAVEEAAPMPSASTVSSSEEGTFVFPPITFTPQQLGQCSLNNEGTIDCEARTYHYTVAETSTVRNITNDTPKTFIVEVSLDEDKNVQAKIINPADGELDEFLTFRNTTRTDATFEINVKKIFQGTWPEGQTFSFTIDQIDKSPMPDNSIITVTRDDPTTSFGIIKIGEDDMTVNNVSVNDKDFSYRICEEIPEDADKNGVYQGIRFDNTCKTVTVHGHMDEQGNISVTDPISGIVSVSFTNRVETEKTPTAPLFYRLPETGFSALRPTAVSEQPLDLKYKPLRWTLEIPSLALETDIVEVPSMGGEYPVTWLGSNAGLLEGYALPGQGASILTGHNHLNTMESGPFVLLREMGIGDRIFVLDPEAEMQIFAVYANEKIAETDVRGLERIAGRFADSLTLITCEDERAEGGYANRRIVAAKPVTR